MRLLTVFKLGRISNLPTVWTNVIAAMVITLQHPDWFWAVLLIVAASLYYVAGMYLNDAFDAGIDAIERPGRPIPSGQIDIQTVWISGIVLMGMGVSLFIASGWQLGNPVSSVIVSVMLAAAIVFYDAKHKGNPFSPVIMGLCRALVYLAVALVLSELVSNELLLAAFAVWSYVIGLTFIARQETLARVQNLWPMLFLLTPFAMVLWQFSAAALLAAMPLAAVISYSLWKLSLPGKTNIPHAVTMLIAGIALLDGMMMAIFVNPYWILTGILGFVTTRLFQRYIPGT